MTLKERILPAAEQAFEASDLGYRAGKFGFLEVLDAQRTLFAVKGQYIEALAAYHQAKAEVERLIGAPLETDHAPHQTGEKIR
jgi:cobalt-zinc-cadmium efflux system outer membrane protein